MNRSIFFLFVRRLFNSLVVLFITVTLLFFLLRVSPGGPAAKFTGPGLSPHFAEQMRESFSLNEPLAVQYAAFVKNLLGFNFGISYSFRLPVTDVILQYLPFTMVFALICIIVQTGTSLLLLLFTLRRRGGWADRLLSRVFTAAYSIPVFITGILLLYIFAFKLDLLPSSGIQSPGEFSSFTEKLFDMFTHMILPVAALAVPGTAMFYTYLRDNAESTYNKTFILYLRSMGLDEKSILRKHIIPNAAAPMISIAGIELGLLFSGAVITEIIFGLPGMGRLIMDAIFSRDYPLIIGCSFISGFLIIISNLLADYLNYKTDKRLAGELAS